MTKNNSSEAHKTNTIQTKLQTFYYLFKYSNSFILSPVYKLKCFGLILDWSHISNEIIE